MRKKIVVFLVAVIFIPCMIYAGIQVYEYYNVNWTVNTVTISSSTATQVDSVAVLDDRLAFAVQNVSATNKIWCKHDNTVAIDNGFVLLPYAQQYLPITTKKLQGGAIMTMYCLAETADSKLTVIQAR